MDFIAKNIAELSPSMTLAITSQAKALKKQGVDVLSFGAGEPDFDAPAHITAAAIEALNTGKTRYTESSGLIELRARSSQRRGRKDCRQRRARAVHLAHDAPAGAALAQVRAQLDELLIRRFAVNERRQQRFPTLALLSGLDARIPRDEGAASFVKATVDFGPAPACLGLDLVV